MLRRAGVQVGVQDGVPVQKTMGRGGDFGAARDDEAVCDILRLFTRRYIGLEGQGYLTRTRNSGGGRQVRIVLTGVGRALQAPVGEVSACLVAASGMNEAAMTRLNALIATLRDRVLAQPVP